jgi:DNA polymerase
MAKRVLHVDIETYSETDLKVSGVHVYAAHPSFQILLVGWALDDEPVRVEDHLSEELKGYLVDDTITKVAHNAAFEMTCFRALGIEIDAAQWECTMIMCAQLGLPRSLDMAGEVLGTSAVKDKNGKQLIRLFCMKGKGARATAQNAPEKWAEFVEYNRRDVEVEREIHLQLSRFGMAEKDLFVIDDNINKRGVLVDVDLAQKAIYVSRLAYASAYERLMAVTGLDKPTDAALKAKYSVSTFAKKEIAQLAKDRPDLEQVLGLRSQLAKTSVKKFEAMLACASVTDHRARGLTAYYGAGRTGRWAGRLIQLQNLPRIGLNDEALETARNALLDGDRRLFDLLYGDSQLDRLSQLIRTALVPAAGHKFIVADFSAIEARVLAWVSGERWRLDVFNGDGRIYETSAERMFNLVPGSVTKTSPYRQKGKVAELALGYGGSVGALTAMGALDMGIEEHELPGLVNAWRSANPRVTAFWKALDTMLCNTLTNKMGHASHEHIYSTREHGPLQIVLPNKRRLTYQRARWGNNRFGQGETFYMGVNQTTNQWVEQDLYGAKATENVVQAIARDCLAEVLVYAERKGYNPVFHVHDELICEVPDALAQNAYDDIMDRMATPPTWAPGLPIKGDGFICNYYSK